MFAATHDREQIRLHAHQRHDVEIYTFGALPNRYAVWHQNAWFDALRGYASPSDARQNITRRFASAKLSPFPCRLRHGRYRFNGTAHHIDKHMADGHALHGLLYDAEFAVCRIGTNADGAWAGLRHDYGGSAGYPFPYRIEILYTLNRQGLSVQTDITNTGHAPLPLADGWHPYFTLGGCADDWTLQLHARRRLRFDAELLPTGDTLDDHRFAEPAPLRGATLDDCFVRTDPAAATPACTLHSQDFTLNIYACAAYPFIQVYLPPERDALALENLSGAPDCFNNGIGRITLPAGDTRRFTVRYDLTCQAQSPT